MQTPLILISREQTVALDSGKLPEDVGPFLRSLTQLYRHVAEDRQVKTAEGEFFCIYTATRASFQKGIAANFIELIKDKADKNNIPYKECKNCDVEMRPYLPMPALEEEKDSELAADLVNANVLPSTSEVTPARVIRFR